jgi:hypothetical protein
MISPEFFQHDGLGTCSLRARLLFVGLWTLCDKAGRMRWNSLVVHGQLFPFERDADIDAAVAELAGVGSVALYRVGSREYLEIPSWPDYQRPHPKEAESSLPRLDAASPMHDSSMNQARAKHEPSMDPSTYGSNPPESESESKSESESVSIAGAREKDDDDLSEGRIDTSEIREQLGMPLFVPPASQAKWAGISRQDAAEVAGLIEWAAGTDRPGRSFLACFDSTGKVTAKRKGNTSGPPGETLEEKRARKKKRFAEMAANLEREIAEKQEAECRG